MSSRKHENVRVLSDLNQGVLNSVMSLVWKLAVIDLIEHLLSFGVEPDRIDIFRKSGTLFIVDVFPERKWFGSYNHISKHIHICCECLSVYEKAGNHPNGKCEIGLVEDVIYG